MISTTAQRQLRHALAPFPRGPRRAVCELMRDGLSAHLAIATVEGVWLVLQDIGFGSISTEPAGVH